ncbi:MAG TPA: MFS transporter [Stellaceae bacterium]|nr:MFS transporter [Stellaceae bacterium]
MGLILVLCFAAFAGSISYRSLDPMLTMVAGDFGISMREAALLVSAYGLPYALMQPVLGPIGDAYSKARLIKICLGVLTASVALAAVAPGFATLMGSRVIAGIVSGGIFPVGLALIGDRTTIEDRQIAASRFLVASIFGQMFGATVSGIIASYFGWRAVFDVVTVLSVASWVIVFRFLDSKSDKAHGLTLRGAVAGYRTVLANPSSLVMFAVVMSEGMLYFCVFPFVGAMLIAHGEGGPVAAGVALAGFAVGGILYGAAVRRMIAALGQWNMLRVGAGMAGIAYLAVAAPVGRVGIALLFVVAGFGFYMMHNTLQTRATELAPSARGSTFALFSAALFIGQGVGPIFAGWVVSVAGFGALFLATGILIATLGVLAAFFLQRRV